MVCAFVEIGASEGHPMNVLVLATCTTSPLFEIALEIAQNELDSGNVVTFLRCAGALGACILNPNHSLSVCVGCRRKQTKGLSLLRGKHSSVFLKPTGTSETAPRFSTLGEVLEFSENRLGYHGVGRAMTALYTATHFRTYQADISSTQGFFDNAYGVVGQVVRAFEEIPRSIDRVYIHNGRFPADKAAIQVCRDRRIEFFCYDTADVKERYVAVPNNPIHDIAHTKATMEKLWQSAGTGRDTVGRAFFERRRGHVNYGSHTFTASQVAKRLPTGLDRRRRIISIFNSTAEEIFTVEGFEYAFYRDERDALERILGGLSSHAEFQVVLRVHPHMRGCDNYQTRYLLDIAKQFPELIFLAPEDTVDSYELMVASEKVVVLNSTMGIEAAFWGKPVVQIGKTYYEDLGCTYRPKSHEELLELLMARELPGLGTSECLKYGYWDLTNGELFVHSTVVGMGRVNFMSVDLTDLKDRAIVRTWNQIVRLPQRLLRGLFRRILHRKGKIG